MNTRFRRALPVGVLSATLALLTPLATIDAASGGTTEIAYDLGPTPTMSPRPQIIDVGGPQSHLFTGYDRTKIVESTVGGAHVRDIAVDGYLHGMAVDDAGNLYVSMWVNSLSRPVLRKLDPQGGQVWEVLLADMDRPGSLGLSNGVLWAALQPGGVVGYSASTGEVVHSFSTSTWQVAPVPNGNVLVSAQGGGVTEFTPSGTPVRTVAGPWGSIATTATGEIVGVARVGTDYTTQAIRKWDASGNATTGATFQASIGDIEVTPDGRVLALLNRSSASSLAVLDSTTPDVGLTASASMLDTGEALTLDASSSTVPFAKPSLFEWDLDGDGSFETSTGVTPTATRAYALPGLRTVSVRVSVPGGGTATRSVPVDVRTASAPGPAGVSINNGTMYTNNPQVTVHMRWPKFAQNAIISNDGGFFPATTAPVSNTLTWTLDSSGPERLPKTIYVRFQGGTSGPETYQDDIILDQTDPAVVSASGAAITQASRVATTLERRLAKVTYKLRLKAADQTSGVVSMQVTSKKSKPGKWKKYAKRSKAKSGNRKLFIRVIDRAGNVSRWKRIKLG